MAIPYDWSDTIRRYSDELRQLSQKSDLPVPAPITDTPPALKSDEEAPASEPAIATVPNLQPAKNTSPPPAAPPFGNETAGTALNSDDFGSNGKETDTGTLTVRLISARGTIPVVGATVTVFRREADGNRLIYMGETDENGNSPEWSLPTVDRRISLEPSETLPYVTYAVQSNAAGFASFLNEGVSIFGGVKTVQRVMMLPLPDSADTTEESLMFVRPADPPSELD